MSKVEIIKLAKIIKSIIKPKPVPFVSYCRRIERVKTSRRVCAMTFDDGPTYDSDITKTILDTLNSFGAKGTFDVIGTTENNYPDAPGKIGTPSWSGTKFDHYPKFNYDKLAGAVNTPDLIDEIISSGHEITNHTFSHILFGKKNVIYSKRTTFKSFNEALEDTKKLHLLLKENHGYEMKHSRPPHYVDKIHGGFTSYDVYSAMGYNYLAASFDGAGWLPRENEEDEINAMVSPLKHALEENPDALCGQIIFQKDGYNMALRAPVKEGLKRQLELLYSYGYKVVGVSDLLNESPFVDVGVDDKDFDVFSKLQESHAIVFSDNCLRPDEKMTFGELAMLIAPREISVNRRIENIKKFKHPYSSALQWAKENGYFSGEIKSIVKRTNLESCTEFIDLSKISSKIPTRREIICAYKNIF